MLRTPEDQGLQELPVRALQAGMYVAAIDRPWEQTPFALQGFYVHTEKDIRLVSEHCNHVFVDPRRRLSTSSSSAQSARAADGPVRNAPLAILPHDFKQARADIESADAAISKVFVHLRRSGRLDVRALRSAIDPLVKGVLRDSVAMAALVRIRRRGEYLYHHSLANAVWAAVLGRHLGMSPSDI